MTILISMALALVYVVGGAFVLGLALLLMVGVGICSVYAIALPFAAVEWLCHRRPRPAFSEIWGDAAIGASPW